MPTEATWLSKVHEFEVAHPAAEGHFPGNPIIPGAVLLDAVLRALASDGLSERRPCGIRAAKFMNPVRPGDRITIRWKNAGAGDITFECRNGEDKIVLRGGAILDAGLR